MAQTRLLRFAHTITFFLMTNSKGQDIFVSGIFLFQIRDKRSAVGVRSTHSEVASSVPSGDSLNSLEEKTKSLLSRT